MLLQTVVDQLTQQPHAVINLILALLLVLSICYVSLGVPTPSAAVRSGESPIPVLLQRLACSHPCWHDQCIARVFGSTLPKLKTVCACTLHEHLICMSGVTLHLSRFTKHAKDAAFRMTWHPGARLQSLQAFCTLCIINLCIGSTCWKLPNAAVHCQEHRKLTAHLVCADSGSICQLEAKVMKQADLIANLQNAVLVNSTAHNELVHHFQQLRAQVRLTSKSQEVLQNLAGVHYVYCKRLLVREFCRNMKPRLVILPDSFVLLLCHFILIR